ncbi:lanthionine synthetase C family protein [Bacillus sp. AFS015896]|uniref:lanthionine synthetase C family protein n=1 Tax=Bacillus sp. AFS015896 TaxID=2033487 RepID=UPI000BFA7835|nr:lanthionine synthetase C family protein [Bacillus sp. AFS015896]PFA61905.1 hypothetical protein CN402_09750 [Bacillus sp. AFS015896]
MKKTTLKNNWKPIEDENLSYKISTLTLALSRLLQDPKKSKEHGLDKKNIVRVENHELLPWQDLSLSHGYPGICLLMGELDRSFPEMNWDITGHEYMKAIQKSLNEDTITSLSLWGGISGIIMGANGLSKGGTRYQNMINTLHTFFLNNYSNLLEESFAQINDGVSMKNYDAIQGWSGIGRYLLEFQENPKIKQALLEVLEYLVKVSEHKYINGQYVPGWYIPVDKLLLDSDKFSYPQGNFNCGLSHGIPGVLALLSLTQKKGIEVPGQVQAIENIAKWLLKWTAYDEYGVYWPNCISWEEHVNGVLKGKSTHRDGWCYGSPGVARSLWLAADALGKGHWKEKAIESYIATFKRPSSTRLLDSPTFCHGIAGLLYMTQCMWVDTGVKELKKLRDELVEEVISLYDSTAPLGYYDCIHENNQIRYVTKVGLLEGTTGIVLSLLSTIQTERPDWDSVFLLN